MNTELNISGEFRCGYVAIVGEPNVGKSTLMNSLLGQKISIVTPKAQTTRHKILGILSTKEYQIIFLDTPGIITPKYMLQEVMIDSASSAMEDADVVLFMIDAVQHHNHDLMHEQAFSRLKDSTKPTFLVINKVDLVHKQELLPMIDVYSTAFPFKEIFPISALRGEGTQDLLPAIAREIPAHLPFYPLDTVSEHNERFFVGEIIREKIFLATKEEIPYSTTVEIVEFKERAKGKSFISADIYVERDSQKGIIIGKGGVMLKEIGAKARKSIEEFLRHSVFLELHVKVLKEWRANAKALARFGYKPYPLKSK